ncbi:MAG: AI-2E family transporter [Lysobacteraceae bacterium]|nr:MAG: AI-2E family transporter [Xanthomonadaceae bacterium]
MKASMNPEAVEDIARFFRRLQWALLLIGVGALIWLLAPVLTPFAAAALLAWLGDPVVDRLQKRGMSRNRAVGLVFSLMLLALIALVLVLIPVIQDQVLVLARSVPDYFEWIVRTGLPWLQAKTGLNLAAWLDPDYLLEMLKRNWKGAGGIATQVLGYLTHSSFAVLGWVANLVLIPFITFFFLRDWDALIKRAADLVPRNRIAMVGQLARESDAVLGSFLRGQFMVMLAMGVFYASGLWIVGLEVGVLIGVLAGLLTFIPYIGPTTVLLGGVTAALVQFGDWQHLVGVLVVWGLGQLLESYVLTPKLVGDRVGLSPVTVVFAVMAGGTLFGFLGMLLALPVASVANVLIRHALERYTASRFYLGEGVDIVTTDSANGAIASATPGDTPHMTSVASSVAAEPTDSA